MNQKITVTLTPEEALRLGLMRPVAEQEIMKPIGKAFMEYAETQNLGPTSFILTLLQVVYNAGRIEGIRAERNRTRKTYYHIITEEFIMKNGTYISIICHEESIVANAMADAGLDYTETIDTVKDLIAGAFRPEEMFLRGNELLIPVPENKGMGFFLNQLRNLVAPCHVAMFNYEPDESGESVRRWY